MVLIFVKSVRNIQFLKICSMFLTEECESKQLQRRVKYFSREMFLASTNVLTWMQCKP